MHRFGRFWFLFIELAEREREGKPPTLIGAVERPTNL